MDYQELFLLNSHLLKHMIYNKYKMNTTYKQELEV